MIRDEAIEEIRERRRTMIKEQYENSIVRLFDDADDWQKQHPDLVVHPEKNIGLRKAS